MERQLGDWMRARLPFGIAEFVMFGLKQGWACLFGGLMLAAIILTSLIWNPDWPVARYDALFLFALATQVAFLRFGLETWAEARVILLFHLTGTAMEWFKVGAGSWGYPEPGLFKVLGVPLFSGFMYACVGSYIARVIRLFDMTFTPYPPFWMTVGLAIGVYINFFAHHFVADFRLGLFALTLLMFGRTMIGFTVGRRYRMPLPLAALLASVALWIAENVGTLTGTWVYAGGAAFDWTDPAKIGSWYLLLYVAFVTVTVVIRDPLVTLTRANTEPTPSRYRQSTE